METQRIKSSQGTTEWGGGEGSSGSGGSGDSERI